MTMIDLMEKDVKLIAQPRFQVGIAKMDLLLNLMIVSLNVMTQ